MRCCSNVILYTWWRNSCRFSLKFRKIVQDEQDANFISRLHAGKLDIIPWPVIESKQFYTLFPALKKRLDQQPVTHPAAGEFLHTLKTLMAKLKVSSIILWWLHNAHVTIGKWLGCTFSWVSRFYLANTSFKFELMQRPSPLIEHSDFWPCSQTRSLQGYPRASTVRNISK